MIVVDRKIFGQITGQALEFLRQLPQPISQNRRPGLGLIVLRHRLDAHLRPFRQRALALRNNDAVLNYAFEFYARLPALFYVKRFDLRRVRGSFRLPTNQCRSSCPHRNFCFWLQSRTKSSKCRSAG